MISWKLLYTESETTWKNTSIVEDTSIVEVYFQKFDNFHRRT